MWNMIITCNISAIHLQMCPIYILPSFASASGVSPAVLGILIWNLFSLVSEGICCNVLANWHCTSILSVHLGKSKDNETNETNNFFIIIFFLYNKYFLGLLPLPGTWGASWRAEQQTDPLPVLGPVEQMVTPVVFTKPSCTPPLLFRYKYQPLDHIRDYFGEQIAIYFAWLGEFLSLDYNISFRESCYTLVCNNLQLFQL